VPIDGGLPNWSAIDLYNFACIYSVASNDPVASATNKSHEYSARGIELLQMAVKAGWHDAAHMKKDTDLDSLREREDFKKLLSDLEANAEKQ
jgi:hypothetical protein